MRRLPLAALLLVSCGGVVATAPPAPDADGGSAPALDGGGPPFATDASPPPRDAGPEADAAVPPPVIVASGFDSFGGVSATDSQVFFTARGTGLNVVRTEPGGAVENVGPVGPVQPWAIGFLGSIGLWFGDDSVLHSWWQPADRVEPDFPTPGVIVALAGDSTRLVTLTVPPEGAATLDVRTWPNIGSAAAAASDLTAPDDVALSGDTAYVTEPTLGTLLQIDIPSATEVAVATSEVGIARVAADVHGAYWTTANEIRMLAAGSITTLSTETSTPTAIATDETGVYWITADGDVRRWDRTTHEVKTLASGFQAIPLGKARSLTLTFQFIVWLTADGNVMCLDKYAPQPRQPPNKK